MFYKKGIDITNDKQMFNFLKNHFEYYTLSSWNRLETIANKVKLDQLSLSGDWQVAYDLLKSGEYESITYMIRDWEREHPTYQVSFNGRSDGYLILKNTDDNGHVLPEEIIEAEDYEEYKRYCKEFYGSVKANRNALRFYTQLVQDFDKLCDELRDYCDELSNRSFEIVEMENAVEAFNNFYAADLDYLGFDELSCDGNGRVDISEIRQLDCLLNTFMEIASREEFGYSIYIDDYNFARLCK